MNTTLEFHDSEVRCVEADASSLRVLFSAAHVHGFAGHSGVAAASGYVRSVEMEFAAATWAGMLPECSGRLSDGRVVSQGVARSIIALPCSSSGPVSAELRFSNGAQLSVTAAGLVCRFTGEPGFVESFAC